MLVHCLPLAQLIDQPEIPSILNGVLHHANTFLLYNRELTQFVTYLLGQSAVLIFIKFEVQRMHSSRIVLSLLLGTISSLPIVVTRYVYQAILQRFRP